MKLLRCSDQERSSQQEKNTGGLACLPRALTLINTDLPPLRVIVALHTGEVLAGVFDDGLRAEFTVLGPAMNALSRIERRAKEDDLDLVASKRFVRLLEQSAYPDLTLREHPVQVDRRAWLRLSEEVVGAGPNEVLKVALGLDDHEMDVEGLNSGASDCLDHDRAERDVRHEAAIHHVDVNPIGASGINRAHLVH